MICKSDCESVNRKSPLVRSSESLAHKLGYVVMVASVAAPCVTKAEGLMIEEITITAQKREQNLQDVGISVTAFSGDQIKEVGFTSTTDVAALTPGLNISQFHPTTTNTVIRGITQGDFSDHLEPPIAAYIDGSYVSSMAAAHVQMFDVERVEVLRGPQGTLFGRNATGGLIHYISKKPTDEFSGYGELLVAEYNQVKLEGAVSGPLSDKVRGRLSVASNNHDGYLKNRIGTDLREADTYSLRGQLEFDLTDDLELRLKSYYSKNDEVGNAYSHQPSSNVPDGLGRSIGQNELGVFGSFFDPTGASGTFTTCTGCDAMFYREPDSDPHTGSFDNPGKFSRTISGVSAQFTWILGDTTLTSISDWFDMDKEYSEDTDSSPLLAGHFGSGAGYKQLSQEFRLEGDLDRLHWQAGLYYLDIEAKEYAEMDNNNPTYFGLPVGDPGGFFYTRADSVVDTQSYAVFGHLEYEINTQWSVTGALRYTEDDKKMDWALFDNFGSDQQINSSINSDLSELTFENMSAKVGLDWRPNDDLLVFASYTRGHKSGNFSTPFFALTVPLSNIPHDEEVLHSYEVGFKGTLFDGGARLNGNLFYYDYEDYQVFTFPNLSLMVVNLDAKAVGGEIELVANPLDGLEVLLGASFIEGEIFDVPRSNGAIRDMDMPYAPGLGFNGLVRYEWAVLDGTMAVQGDFNYNGDFCFTASCSPTEEEDSYVVGNARISYTTGDEKWKISAFVRNISDKEYRVYALDNSVVGFTASAFAPPRWFGGSVSYTW